MKKIFAVPVCIMLLLVSCENTGPGDITAKYTGRTECKNLISIEDFNTDKECIEYTYDGSNLEIKHVNAGLNCCPEPINARITVENGVITIDESKSANGCRCLCLFDIDYKVENLPAGTYKIIVKPFIELNGEEPLEGSITLKNSSSGFFCADRANYPWSIR